MIGAGFVLLVFWPGSESQLIKVPIVENGQRNPADFFNIPNPSAAEAEQEAILMFVGDIMLSRRVGAKAVNQNDWRWSFLKMADVLRQADLTFGNLESMISDQGRNVGSIYSFRADPRMLEGLTFSGFDVLMLANNHTGDWTRLAFEDTMTRLTQADIGYCGAGWHFSEAHQPVIRQAGAAQIGFLCYTNLAPLHMKASAEKSGIAWMDLEQLQKDIAAAKTAADIVIVSMHTGEEYQEHPNKYQKDFARAAIDFGADLVVGHHPHVTQDLENYHDRWIAYSLGNFIFDQDFSEGTMHGWLLKVVVSGQQIISVEPLDVDYDKDFQPCLKDSAVLF